jgi:hypothetical protein
VKEKVLGQPVVVKERKRGRMVVGRRGQQRQVRRRLKGREEETPSEEGNHFFLY